MPLATNAVDSGSPSKWPETGLPVMFRIIVNVAPMGGTKPSDAMSSLVVAPRSIPLVTLSSS